MPQNTWIPLRKTHLSHDVKTVRFTPWITRATTAHPTASPRERTSTSTSPSTSTPSTALPSSVWKRWGETVYPSPTSLLLPSQPQLQAPTSRSPSRPACLTTPSLRPSPLHLACLATTAHRPTSSTPITPSNLQDNLSIQVASPPARAKQELLPKPRCASQAPCPLRPPSGTAACQPTRPTAPCTPPAYWSMVDWHQVKSAGRSWRWPLTIQNTGSTACLPNHPTRQLLMAPREVPPTPSSSISRTDTYGRR